MYLVEWDDLDRYQSFLYDLPDVPRELYRFDGQSRRDSWTPQPIYAERPRLEPPDLWHLWGTATIVMAPPVAELLADFVDPVGELLPLRRSGTGETFLALNILRDVDCLDPAGDNLDELELYTMFVEDRLPESGLFKIPQCDDVAIFYLDRAGEEETLREAIERHDLHGLLFVPVWASDGSVAPVNLLEP